MTPWLALLPGLASATPDVGDATALTGALAAVLGQASLVWEEGADARSCADVTTDKRARTMTFDFTGCEERHDITGTVVIDVVSARHLVATYQEDFVSQGHHISGSFSAQALSRRDFQLTTTDALGGATLLVVSALDSDEVSEVSDLDVGVTVRRSELEMQGTGSVHFTSGEDAADGVLSLGAGEMPLVWERPLRQALPMEGMLSLSAQMSVELELELVPVTASVAGTFWVEFAPVCEEGEVSFTAEEDATVTISVQVGEQVVEQQLVVPAAQVEEVVNAELESMSVCL